MCLSWFGLCSAIHKPPFFGVIWIVFSRWLKQIQVTNLETVGFHISLLSILDDHLKFWLIYIYIWICFIGLVDLLRYKVVLVVFDVFHPFNDVHIVQWLKTPTSYDGYEPSSRWLSILNGMDVKRFHKKTYSLAIFKCIVVWGFKKLSLHYFTLVLSYVVVDWPSMW